MYKSVDSWIEYLHPKLGYPVIARIEDEEKIKLQGYIIVKKVVNGEEMKLKHDMKGGYNMNKDELIRFFEDAGYDNVEIIGNRLLFTTGEDVINWSIQEAIKFIGR